MINHAMLQCYMLLCDSFSVLTALFVCCLIFFLYLVICGLLNDRICVFTGFGLLSMCFCREDVAHRHLSV